MKSGRFLDHYRPAEFFAFRTPLLPFNEYFEWIQGLEANTSVDDPLHLERALSADRERLRKRLYQLVSRSEIDEAIFVASPDLRDSRHIWHDEPNSKRGIRIESAFLRYFLRMTTRATPFGMFAGYSIGATGQATRLEICCRSAYQRRTRPDMDFLFALVESLSANPLIRSDFRYRPNSSLHQTAGQFRYVESRLKNQSRTYHLIAVEDSNELTETLIRANDGKSIDALAAPLVSPGIELKDATEFIHDLIDSQILVPEIAFPVTGPEPLSALIDQFRAGAKTVFVAEILDEARRSLVALDAQGLGGATEGYRKIADSLEALPVKVNLPRLFQVDMMKPAPCATLGTVVIEEMAHGAAILQSVSHAQEQQELVRFRDAFVNRYEGREVPFLEALDEETGIGFGESDESSPLLADFQGPERATEKGKWGDRESFLLRKVNEAIESGLRRVDLSAQDLKALESVEALPLPDSFAMMGILAARSEADITTGKFSLFLENVLAGGARLLGRFCHVGDTLHQLVEQYLREEEKHHPDAIFAEIIHLPEGRVGNILARPRMRPYEIPYLGYSTAPQEFQIPAGDLRISVRDGRVILRSERLGREILPRMTNAHNYDRYSVGVYRFLCNLQFQGVAASLVWNWGALKNAPFLPRVTHGRLVFSIARWCLYQDEIVRLDGKKGAALFQEIRNLRSRRNIPRLVTLREYDNALLVDFDNILSIETFAHLIKPRQEAILTELFPEPDELCAFGPEGKFVHELVVPFVKIPPHDKKRASSNMESGTSKLSHRAYPPGSEWLYAKLYAGTVTVDHLLRDFLPALLAEIRETSAVDSWFFLRYGDPDWHLRLRFHGDALRLHQEVLPRLRKSFSDLLQSGKIHKAQLDTYEPEVERYGGPEGMNLAEKIFHIDSEAVLEIIGKLEPGDEGLDERWRLALRGMDLLLRDLGFDTESKLAVISKARESFGKEFGVARNETLELSRKIRKWKPELEMLLDSGWPEDHPLADGFEILANRSRLLLPFLSDLRELDFAGKFTVSIQDLALSYIHMHANRLLRSAHRRQELVIYDFMKFLYKSQMAKSAGSK